MYDNDIQLCLIPQVYTGSRQNRAVPADADLSTLNADDLVAVFWRTMLGNQLLDAVCRLMKTALKWLGWKGVMALHGNLGR